MFLDKNFLLLKMNIHLCVIHMMLMIMTNSLKDPQENL